MARDQRNYREIDKQKRRASKEPRQRERCISCGRRIQPGDQWCAGSIGGTRCDTDLRDSNNRITELL